MRNIYGNRSIIPNNYYFTFDRIYTSRSEVNDNDDVFIGRTVLADAEHEVYLKTVKGYIKVAKLDNEARFNYLEGKYLNQENSFNNIDNLKSGGTTPHGNGTYLIEYSENGSWPNPNGFNENNPFLEKGDLFLLHQYTIEKNGEDAFSIPVYQTLTDLRSEIKEKEKHITHNNKTFIRSGIITYKEVASEETGTKYLRENETSNFFEDATGKYTRTIEWENWYDTSERYIGYLGNLSSTNNINKTNLVDSINYINNNVIGDLQDLDNENARENINNVATIIEALNNLDTLIGKGKLLGKKNSNNPIGIKATNIINALLEHDAEIGELEKLTNNSNGINKTSLVESINQLNRIIGVLDNSNTQTKSNIISIINELVDKNNMLETNLKTTDNYVGTGNKIIITNDSGEEIVYDTLAEFVSKALVPVLETSKDQINKLSENMDILDTTLAFYVNQQEKENGIDTYMNWGAF